MKKLLIAILMLFICILSVKCQTTNSNIQTYNTVSFTKANIYNNHYYWGKTVHSNIIIKINLNYDIITIYSPKIQIYKIISNGYTYSDKFGSNVIFKAKDQDNDDCFIRIRISNNSNQLYIDYKNIAYCYKIIQIK